MKMNKEIQELYDSMVNMSIVENTLQSEIQQLEKEHVTLNDVLLDRQENPNTLHPGDVSILLTKDCDSEELRYYWYRVEKDRHGYYLTNINGMTVHRQTEPYDYEQTIDLNGTSTKI